MEEESEVSLLINDILKSEPTEEILKEWSENFTDAVAYLRKDEQAAAMSQFLTLLVDGEMFGLLEKLVNVGVLSSRTVCEALLNSDKLVYERQDSWAECFGLILRMIASVDYRGVLNILKGCIEKAQTIPVLNFTVQPQLEAVEHVLEKILDRNASLVPCYSVLTEIQKIYPESLNWPHHRLARLMTSFVESFRPVAQMVTTTGYSKMLPVIEHAGYVDHLKKSWRLNPRTLKLSLKGSLPYDAELLKPRTELVRYVLQQPHSRELAASLLNVSQLYGRACVGLEEHLCELVVAAMEKAEEHSNEKNEGLDGTVPNHSLWVHVASQIVYFGLQGDINFANTIALIRNKLSVRNLTQGRDHLMWALLQFTAVAIHRNLCINYRQLLELCYLLYPEEEPLPIPDCSQAICTHRMAATSIWIHLRMKADWEYDDTFESVPIALKDQYEFLDKLPMPTASSHTNSDYKLVLVCNAYSINTERFRQVIEPKLIEIVVGPQLGQKGERKGLTEPLSISILECSTGRAKLRMLTNIVMYILKLVQANSRAVLAPVLMENYSRLLFYSEVENLGFSTFIKRVMPAVYETGAWEVMISLLDMLSYKMYNMQPVYQVEILCHLHTLRIVLKANHAQVYVCLENTILRWTLRLRWTALTPRMMTRYYGADRLISTRSQEINRVLVLTMARSMRVTGMIEDSPAGPWCKDILKAIVYRATHPWPDWTLQFFPPMMQEFFKNPGPSIEILRPIDEGNAEEDYKFWLKSNDEDVVAYFSKSTAPLTFFCIIFKTIWEGDEIKPIVWKVLEKIDASRLSTHLRKFCDYLITQFTNCAGEQQINKCIDTVDQMIWKYNFVSIDRLVLYLALSRQVGSKAQASFFIIRLLLLKDSKLRDRIQEFVKENSPEDWRRSFAYEQRVAFYKKFPETFVPVCVTEETGDTPSQCQDRPACLANVCLRFMTVFDILIHLYVEIPLGTKSLEVLLDQFGDLYKFHDKPVTYLYETLHYYEESLRNRPALKRKLATVVLRYLRENPKPPSVLSESFLRYTSVELDDDDPWTPKLEYYMGRIGRMVEVMTDASHCHSIDWRFNEFSGPSSCALYVTCVELMTLPVAPDVVTAALLDVIAKGHAVIPPKDIHLWINCVGLVMTALPDAYWTVFYDRLVETVSDPGLAEWQYGNLTPFQMFNFDTTYKCLLECKYSHMLAVAQSIWHHANPRQICAVPQFVKEKLQSIVTSEEQLLFVCHLVGPALTRLHDERPRGVADLAVNLVEILEQIDRTKPTLKYMDTVCDLLYYMRYTFVGELINSDVKCVIQKLSPALQSRLKFIGDPELTKTSKKK